MRRQSPCRMCGKSTRKFLINDVSLGIHACSYACEHKYLDTLSTKEEAELLGLLDNRISGTKHHLSLIWAVAGAGVLVILLGFLMKTVTVFVAGVSLSSVCAFLTRYLEERIAIMTQTRKHIHV